MTTINKEFKPLLDSMEAEWKKTEQAQTANDVAAKKILRDGIDYQKTATCECYARQAIVNNGSLKVALLHFGVMGTSNFQMPSVEQFDNCKLEGAQKASEKIKLSAEGLQKQ